MLHYKNSRGFILLTVLIFLQILSLSSLYSLMHITSVTKKNTQQWQSQNTQWRAYQIIKKLEMRVAASSQISIIPVMAAVDISHQSLSWWELNTCSDNLGEIRYYYAVELLGSDMCGRINNQFAATYMRITLNIPNQSLLQSTIAVSGAETPACQGKPHLVYLGRQMVRVL